MTNNRTDYIYKFQGQVLRKKPAQSSPASKYAGQPYYVLTIRQPDHTKKSIQVFRSKLAHDSIWTAIEQGTYSGQYVFYCRNQKGYYYLVNWEQLKSKSSEPKPNRHDLN